MEFGSSHVYASVPFERYYSSGSRETANFQQSDAHCYDPIYESIEDVKKKPNQPLPYSSLSDMPSSETSENAYSVADENASKYDIPCGEDQAPVLFKKPAIYQSPEEKEVGSLEETKQKTLKNQEKGPSGSLQSGDAVCYHEEIPCAPPRKPRAKTLSSIPPPIPSRQSGFTEAVAEPLGSSNALTSSVPDLSEDFKKPAVMTPLLKPPPSIPKQKNVLPNAPFDPFALPEQTDSSIQQKEELHPAMLRDTINQHSTSSIATRSVVENVKEAVDLSGNFKSNNSDASAPSTDVSNSSFLFCPTNPFSQNYKPPKLSESDISDTPLFNLKEASSHQEGPIIATDVTHVMEANGIVDSNVIPPCYPSLSHMVDDHETLDATPSAPPLTATLMRKDAEFLQQQLRTLNVEPSDQVMPDDDSFAQEVGVTSLIRPSAPQLSQSMIRRDRDLAKRPFKRTNSTEPTYACADTNIVCVKLGIIGDNRGSFVHSVMPSHCLTCGAIANNTEQEWNCIFCESKNSSQIQSVSADCANDVTYVLQPAACPSMADESLVVFCVDTSGSMCVSSEVTLGTGCLFVSRLKSLQQAISDQLNIIEATKPNCRVALVTFNSEVQMLGDGSPEQAITLSEYQLLDFDYLCHTGWHAPLPSFIQNSRVQLTKAVLGLKESGGTALGPALLLSTAMASKLPGSQVVVCTDGRANVGVGSLETEEDYASCHHFYNQATGLAASRGVIVSIMSIAGSDCRLVQLGKVADKTSGKVSIVEASELSEAFENVILGNVLATNVSIDLVTQKHLYFYNEESIVGSTIAQFIGNITSDSEVTFRYGMHKDNEVAVMPPPKEAYFQLKIMYRSRDGAVNMRVMTQQRLVTDDRTLAESEMNPAVIGTYASQSAARLALQGDLDTAQQVTNAHKELVNRGMSLKSTTDSEKALPQVETIYECVLKRMNDIGQDLSQIDASSTSSSDSQSQNATTAETDLIPEDVYDDDEICDLQQPPALPPRVPPNQKKSKPPLKHSSSSFESMLSKLSSKPKGPKLKAKKTKRNKEKTALQYKDQSAQKMFNMSKATTGSFRLP